MRQKAKKAQAPPIALESPTVAFKKNGLCLAIVALFGFAAYFNSLNGVFLWDDETLVQNNPFIRKGVLSPQIFTTTLLDGTGGFSNFYRPFQVLTYVIDRIFWNNNVIGYHLTNVLFHVSAAWALFWLSGILFGSRFLSFVSALFFVVHPVHTEAVSYIAGRADPLSTMFLLLAFIFYLKSEPLLTPGVSKGFPELPMAVSFVAALLSRENALMLVPLVLFYHFAWKRPFYKKGFWLLVILSLGTLALRAKILSSLVITSVDPNQPGVLERLPGFFVALPQYLKLLIAPFGLHMEYGGILFPWAEKSVLFGLLIFAAYGVLLERTRKKNPFIFWCLGWFLLCLLPASHLFLVNAYMAEHWLYLPSIGFFWMLGSFIQKAYERPGYRFWVSIGIAGIVFYFSILTIQQNRYWRDPILLYQRLIHYAPNSAKVYNNLAKAYYEAGKKEDLIRLLKKAIEVDPKNAPAYNNLGNALKDAGRFEEAAEAYRKAIEFEPLGAHQYHNLSLIYSEYYKDPQKAKELLEKALSVNPRYADANQQLAFLAIQAGQFGEAEGYTKKVLEIYSDKASAYKYLGYIYYRTGRLDQAEEALRKAVELKPDYGEAQHDLAVVLFAKQNFAESFQSYQKAAKYGHADPELAKGLAEHGFFMM